MSVLRASKMFRVPENTLRDRVLGKVDPETVTMGKLPLFDQFQEAKIVEHFKTMADLGYGYTQQECISVASQYAFQLGLRSNDKPLSMMWMKGFLGRWPEMRVIKPRALEDERAKLAKESVVMSYFDNLEKCLRKHDLLNKPHLIYNIDEKGVSIEHKPPFIVAGSGHPTQAVTSGKGKTVTIIGAGSASGAAVPAYFVFPGKRMNFDLLKGATPGASGTVSDNGWSNLAVFHRYLTEHFIQFVPGRGSSLLLLLDGHKSHVSLTLADWAKKNNIVMFILPAHTSHILQPLDVACYGPFQRMYYAQCHKVMRQVSATITKYNICDIACKVYSKALSSENLQSGFMRTGIFPTDRTVVPKHSMIPSQVFESDDISCSQCSESTVEGGIVGDTDDRLNIFVEREKDLRSVKVEGCKAKKQRNTVSKYVSGKEFTSEEVMSAVQQHENRQKNATKKINPSKNGKEKVKGNVKSTVKSKGKENVKRNIHSKTSKSSPLPGPPHINLALDSSSSSDEMESEDSDVCCVCGLFQPKELANCVSLTFVKWAACDGKENGVPCQHWTHLQFCSPVRFIRRGDTFLCLHCKSNEE